MACLNRFDSSDLDVPTPELTPYLSVEAEDICLLRLCDCEEMVAATPQVRETLGQSANRFKIRNRTQDRRDLGSHLLETVTKLDE